jgi:hypothetical protein
MNETNAFFGILLAYEILLNIIIPILIIYFVFKLVKKILNIKVAYSILGLIIILFIFKIYTLSYPLENSYTQIFKDKTGLNFPKSAKYLEKTYSNSGNGIYWSKIKISNDDYLKLKTQIEKSNFTKVDYYAEDLNLVKTITKIKNNDVDKIYNLQSSYDQSEYVVIFSSDKKTLILYYQR